MISKCINEYIEKHKTEPEKIKQMSDFIEKFFMELEPEDIDIRDAFVESLGDFSNEITHENIERIIKELRHRDNSVSGEKWSCDEINQIISQYDVKNKISTYNIDFCREYFWYAMNYVYAAHYNISRTMAGYAELAIDEYCNKNMCLKKYIVSRIKETAGSM